LEGCKPSKIFSFCSCSAAKPPSTSRNWRFESGFSAFIVFVDEWRAWPIAERRDQHAQAMQEQIQW